MTLDLSDIIEALDDNAFEEVPVDVVTFVTAPEYLGQPPLSENQYTLVECMSQIYREEDLIRNMGIDEGKNHFKKYTKVEIILQCGKGCHDPNTPTFDPQTGKWIPLATMKEGLVATMRGNEYATEPFYEGNGEMVRVKTSLGFEENVYIGHKYYWMKKNKFYKRLRDNNVGSFQEVRNIRVGDRIAIGLNMSPDDPINIPPEHAELIGYWLGDGTLPTDKNPMLNMDFCNSETESIENYLRLCQAIGDEPYRINHKNKNMVSFVHRKNSYALHLAKKYGIFGLRSKTKFIPDAVWKSDNDTLALTISRLWQTDGCIYEKNGMTAEYVSVSEQLAYDVHRALLRLGVPSSIRSRIPKSNFANASRAYYVTVTSQECFNAFSDRIHLLDHKAMKKLEKRGRVYSRLDNNIYWDRVVSIEPLRNNEYWTRTVPQSGHYIGNGFISANSGKDHTSTIACAYIIYKLLCLKDPARYYGKPPDDSIDLINIAINAEQAKNVFFDNFVRKIKNSPWFSGKYDPKVNSVAFKKSITMYSGHSERESHEGLNLFLAILDEISGFASQSAGGNEQAKTAENTYRAFRGSVDSRFPDFGKVVLLSFPRYKGDFIQQAYDNAIADKETITRNHKFILNPDLPEDDSNTFEIEWEEDHILSYKYPKVFALKRPTWEVNPTRSIEDFKIAFFKEPADALMRFACMPTTSSDAFFKSREKVEKCLSVRNPLDSFRRFDPSFKPDQEKIYYVHADLAQRHDKCAVAISHIEKWVKIQAFNNYEQIVPFVVVDAVAWWEPRVEGPVDLSEVKNWIISLRRNGFNLGIATFDRWQCLPGHSLVHTPNGPKTMKDIQEGDYVMTRYGKSAVGSKMDTGEQEVFRITTRLGYEFEGTANHKMLTKDGWKTIGNLSNYDELLLSNRYDWEGVDTITPDQAYVFGALISDGWINDASDHQIMFTTSDNEFAEKVNRLMIDAWGFKNKILKKIQKKTNGSIVDTFAYRYWDKEMILRMRAAGLHRGKSETKIIPMSVLQGSPEVRAAFLSGYIDGDGGCQHYFDKNNIKRSRITFDTLSENLASQLVWLSISLGLDPTRLRQIRENERVMHRLTFEGRRAERLLDIINLSIPRKSILSYERKKDVKERWIFENNQLWLKIKKIEAIGIMQTYDISVPEYGEFIANGFVTHNSFDIQRDLRSVGINSETLSVAKKHYEDLAMLIYEERVAAPHIELLLDELLELRIMPNNRVDHPRKKSKDLADAMCGSVYNAISHGKRETTQEIEIHTWDNVKIMNAKEDQEKKEIPEDIRQFLINANIL